MNYELNWDDIYPDEFRCEYIYDGSLSQCDNPSHVLVYVKDGKVTARPYCPQHIGQALVRWGAIAEVLGSEYLHTD